MLTAPGLTSFNRFSPLQPQVRNPAPALNPSKPVAAPAEMSSTAPVGREARVERAAGNILNAIYRQLTLDADNGRSQAQLQSRFNAGVEGFLQGFGEAMEMLEQGGMLSDELRAELGETESRVLQGLADMAAEFGLSADALPESEAPVPVPPTETLPGNVEALLFGKNQFSFSLTTRDGDKVNIASVSEFRQGGSINGNGFAYYEQQRQGFSFQVQGELDEGELAAINDLLGQVNELSALFYGGDLDAAFDAALALDFNAEEIAGYALDLRQTMITKVRTTYGQPAAETSPLREKFQPLTQMADQIEAALARAQEFLEPLRLMTDLLDQAVLPADQAERGGRHKLFGDVGKAMVDRLM